MNFSTNEDQIKVGTEQFICLTYINNALIKDPIVRIWGKAANELIITIISIK